MRRGYKNKSRLPSWVPDWRLVDHQRILHQFQAATKVKASITFANITIDVPEILGTFIDVIDRVVESDTLEKATFGPEMSDVAAGINHIELIKAAILTHRSGLGSRDYCYAFISALIFNERALVEGEDIISHPNYPCQRMLNFEARQSVEYVKTTSQSDTIIIRERGQRFMMVVINSLAQKTFFLTQHGDIGVGPDGMMPGDTVVVFDGARTPSVLRHVQKGTATDHNHKECRGNSEDHIQKWEVGICRRVLLARLYEQ